MILFSRRQKLRYGDVIEVQGDLYMMIARRFVEQDWHILPLGGRFDPRTSWFISESELQGADLIEAHEPSPYD